MATLAETRKSQGWHVFLGVAGILLGILAQSFVGGREYLLDGLLLYAIAIVMTLLGCHAVFPSKVAGQTEAQSVSLAVSRRTRSREVLFIAVAVNVIAVGLFASKLFPNLAWGLYLGSVVVAVLALAPPDAAHQAARWAAKNRQEMYTFGSILFLALVVRLFRITEIPFGLWWDEASYGLQTLQIMSDPNYRPVFVGGTAQMPALLWYVMVPAFWLFGPGIAAVRLVAAVGGVLGVGATYLLGRELLDKRLAAVSALILATMAWHVNWSRIGMAGIWSVAFDALAAFCILRALRLGSTISYGCAGLFLGLGLNMYFSSRLLPIVLGLVVLHRIVSVGTPFVKHQLPGLVVFCAIALLTVSPLLQFALSNPAEFNARTETVSVLGEIRQTGSFQPLVENVRRHLLMFNFQGDNNGRHNVAGRPMLDNVSAALFTLGLAMTARSIRKREGLFLITWTIVMLAGGVFSLTFEAPQGYRTIDEVISIALIASLPLISVWGQVERLAEAGKAAARWRRSRALDGLPKNLAIWFPVLLLAGVSLGNLHRYFVEQAADPASIRSFSTAETMIAREINGLTAGYQLFLDETYLGHPTISFMTGRKEFHRFDPVGGLPLRGSDPVAVYFAPDRTQDFNTLRKLYPKSEPKYLRPPGGGDPLAIGLIIDHQSIAATMGVSIDFLTSESPGAPPISVARASSAIISWPKVGAGNSRRKAILRSVLAVQQSANYDFRVEGSTSATLLIDGNSIRTDGSQDVLLVRGNHSVTIEVDSFLDSPVKLTWRRQGEPGFSDVPQNYLYASPVTNNGLLGSFYKGTAWSGQPEFQQITPHLDIKVHNLPMARPYSVEWEGMIDVPRSGQYRIGVDSADASWVSVDGDLVATNDGAPRQLSEGSVSLEEGYHRIRVRWIDATGHTYLKLLWTPPGEERMAVPSDRLYPPMGVYPPHRGEPAILAIPPSLPSLKMGSSPGRSADIATSLSADNPILQAEGLMKDPRDIAVLPGGRLVVVDTVARQVGILSPDGSQRRDLEGSFEQPFAAAVTPTRHLLVLDSLTKDPVHAFSSEGKPIGLFGSSLGTYRPRGIGTDSSGAIYIADTGRGRVLKLAEGGGLISEFRAGGRMGQPVSVAAGSDGLLYVVDSDKHQVWVLNQEDKVLAQWAIRPSNTYDAPKIALGTRGEVLVSEPGAGTVRAYNATGTAIGQIGAPGRELGQLLLPTGVRVDDQGFLWVADTGNRRIQRWTIR